MGLNVIIRIEPIYSVFSFGETHVTTVECVEWDFFLCEFAH